MHLVTKVRLFRSPYTICYLTEDDFTISDKQLYKSIGVNPGNCVEAETGDVIVEKNPWQRPLKFTAPAVFLQPFVKECVNSAVYRHRVLTYLNEISGCPDHGVVFLKLILEPPDHEIIDYAWNDRMLRLTWTRVEIENAFSWLSTLGGAYSALGDYFEHCAEEAGRISLRQYKLSKMLGDDALAARSRLYSAIAYAQKGRLKLARHIVRNIYSFAIETKDKRLVRMCQGVWVKLRYMKQQCRYKTKSLSQKIEGMGIGNGEVLSVR